MMNHHYEVDWLAGWMCADRASVLGNCRVIAKKVLGLTPVMGWSWFVSDGILIHRNWDKDKDILANSIKLVLHMINGCIQATELFKMLNLGCAIPCRNLFLQ